MPGRSSRFRKDGATGTSSIPVWSDDAQGEALTATVPRPSAAINVTIVDAADLGGLPGDEHWSVSSCALSLEALRHRAADARFTASFLVADDGAPLGILPLYRYRSRHFPSSIFDPAVLAPSLFSPTPADGYLLVGGSVDLVAGALVASDLDDASAADVVSTMVDAAFAHAAGRGLRAAAAYVRDEQVAAFAGSARATQAIEQFAAVPIPDTGEPGYLRGLDHSRRSVVRRDWARLDRLGLRATEQPASEAPAESAALVAAVKRRHGVADHPRLAALRLAEWSGQASGTRLAFVVRDGAPAGDRCGAVLAVSFGCHHGNRLEMHEVGLVDESDVRGLVYAEVLFYAPLRYAARHSCEELQLGLGSPVPKRLRGARLSPVWAIGQADQDG